MNPFKMFGRQEQEPARARPTGPRPPDYPLDRADFHSVTWHAIRTWAEEEIESLRARNDSLKNSETDTAAMRGEIQCLKRLLELPTSQSAPPHVEPVRYE